MENKYRVSVVDDYRKLKLLVFLPLLVFFLLLLALGFLLEYKIILPKQLKYEVVMPVFVMFFLVFGYFFHLFKNTYSKEELAVTDNHIESSRIGMINFSQIQEYKPWTIKGYTTYFIKVKTGKKIAIGPSNNFTSSADKIFGQFIKDFENRIRLYNSQPNP